MDKEDSAVRKQARKKAIDFLKRYKVGTTKPLSLQQFSFFVKVPLVE